MSTSKVYALRKEDKKVEACRCALELYRQSPNDDDIKKALSWTFIDMCKKFISENNLDQAQIFHNQVSRIEFDLEDDFVETIKKQVAYLKPRVDVHFQKIQNADQLSKSGQHKEAMDLMQSLLANNQLTEAHHESCGWIIYRYIKAEENNLSSVQVRTCLRDYMNLKNERPSKLHSVMLNFALKYYKSHGDFRFYDFFVKWWRVENLRDEDLYDGINQNLDKIPSLISRICREFVNQNIFFDIEETLVQKIALSRETILDFFREPYFWNVLNAQKERRFSQLWQLFENYNYHYSKYGKSKWHSQILELAERFMSEQEEWRFLDFFKNWNPQNFSEEDWKETINGDYTNKPLAIKAIKKAFKTLNNKGVDQDVSWLLELYEKAVRKFPDDEWLLREKALLHLKNKEPDRAIEMYKKLALELADKYYIWQEFSKCFDTDNPLKIGMLSKALESEKNEDFLGDIHLELARLLLEENLVENAFVELEVYKKHRELKGWKLSPTYAEFQTKIAVKESSLKNNRELYRKYTPFAEDFAYSDFEWQEVVLVGKWKDEKNKERLSFTDGKSINFQVGIHRFNVLKQSDLGEVFRFRLQKNEVKKEVQTQNYWERRSIVTEYKYVPLAADKTGYVNWSILDDIFAVVDYINRDKNIVHAITTDHETIFFPQPKNILQIGDFITAKHFAKKVKGETRTEIRNVQTIEKEKAISKFPFQIALVDGVNEEKQLFHFVINDKLSGIVKYSECKLRPNEGDFAKLWFVTKTDKKNGGLRIKVLNIEDTCEVNPAFQKEINGFLELKYKNENEEMISPDFAFVGNYYVPKHLLERHRIYSDCQVKAKIIRYGGKWKVVEIEKLNE